MQYVFGEILFWLLAALLLGGGIAVLWMRLVMGSRDDAQLAPLRDRIAALETEGESLRRDVGEARDRATERETQLSALKDDLAQRDERIVTQAAEIERLREAASAEPASSGVEDQALRREVTALKVRLADRDGRISELAAELANAREAYHHLEAAQFGSTQQPAPAAGPEAAPEAAPEAPHESSREPRPEPPKAADQSAAQAADGAHALAEQAPNSTGEEELAAPPLRSEAPDSVAVADDLTRIRGIGKVLERHLNTLGITTYAQIAAFSEEDVARLDDVVTPKGRVSRERWIDQARDLIAGEGGAADAG